MTDSSTDKPTKPLIPDWPKDGYGEFLMEQEKVALKYQGMWKNKRPHGEMKVTTTKGNIEGDVRYA